MGVLWPELHARRRPAPGAGGLIFHTAACWAGVLNVLSLPHLAHRTRAGVGRHEEKGKVVSVRNHPRGVPVVPR